MSHWVEKWDVEGSSGNTWTVSRDEKGNYGCSCPVWKFKRKECKHIIQVKISGGIPKAKRPEIILAAVRKPVYKAEENRLLIPLVGMPDAHMMEATICYYLLKYGYGIGEIRQIRRYVPTEWTMAKIIRHVEVYGEAEYPENWYRAM